VATAARVQRWLITEPLLITLFKPGANKEWCFAVFECAWLLACVRQLGMAHAVHSLRAEQRIITTSSQPCATSRTDRGRETEPQRERQRHRQSVSRAAAPSLCAPAAGEASVPKTYRDTVRDIDRETGRERRRETDGVDVAELVGRLIDEE
jgi:hypothetical protein